MNLKPAIRSGIMNQPLKVEEKPRLTKEQAKDLIDRMQSHDSEMVTGKFHNQEAKGQGVRFSICLYPGDEYDVYEFFDGERYRIPRGVARHINNCAYKQYATLNTNLGAVQADVSGAVPVNSGRYIGGNNMMQAVKKEHRFSFESLEFTDDNLDLFQSSVFMKDVGPLPQIL